MRFNDSIDTLRDGNQWRAFQSQRYQFSMDSGVLKINHLSASIKRILTDTASEGIYKMVRLLL
jgi:hypothetical protein